MKTEKMRDSIRKVDRAHQRAARTALLAMVTDGRIQEGQLELVATTGRNYRKSLKNVTVQDLINMGIVVVA